MAKPTKAWLADRRRDVELADQRLGDVDDRCRWLLDVFTTTDPATLPRSERSLWRDHLMALVLRRLPSMRIDAEVYEREPLDSELPELWRRVRELVGAHRASVRLPELRIWFGRHPVTPDEPRVATPYTRMGVGLKASDFGDALMYAVVDLLSACRSLRECDECHRLFVANRRQKRHLRCARRVHDRNRPSRKKKGDK